MDKLKKNKKAHQKAQLYYQATLNQMKTLM